MKLEKGTKIAIASELSLLLILATLKIVPNLNFMVVFYWTIGGVAVISGFIWLAIKFNFFSFVFKKKEIKKKEKDQPNEKSKEKENVSKLKLEDQEKQFVELINYLNKRSLSGYPLVKGKLKIPEEAKRLRLSDLGNTYPVFKETDSQDATFIVFRGNLVPMITNTLKNNDNTTNFLRLIFNITFVNRVVSEEGGKIFIERPAIVIKNGEYKIKEKGKLKIHERVL